MPVACSTSALTGQDGSLYYTPAATEFCLLDFTDFPAGDEITVPSLHDFRVNDPVKFIEEGGSLCDELDTTTQYYVVATTDTTISVSETKGGTAITLTQSGGTGAGDTAGGHIKIKFDPYEAICTVASWDLTIEREELEVTTLPCGIGESGVSGGKYAPFRKTQSGYASGTGTITVYFVDNDASLGMRMLDNVMLSNQMGARVRLFINTVAGVDAINLADSMYIDADISLTSMNVGVNPDDPTQAELGYTLSNVTHLFKQSLV